MGGWGGNVDDNVTQTHPTVPPQEPFYSVFTVLSSCPTFLHNLNPYFWSMRIKLRCSYCSQKNSKLVGGKLFSGMFLALDFGLDSGGGVGGWGGGGGGGC